MCSVLVRITLIFKCLSYLLLKLGTIACGMLPHSHLPVFKSVWEEFRLVLSDSHLHSHPHRFIFVKLLPPQVAVVRVKQVRFLWCQLWTVNWVGKNKPPFNSDLSPFLSQLTCHHLENPASTTLWITMFLYDFLMSNMTTSDLVNSFPHRDTSVLSRNISLKGLLFRVYSCLMRGVQWRSVLCRKCHYRHFKTESFDF